MNTKNLSVTTVSTIAHLRELVRACERAHSEAEILPLVLPLQEGTRSLRQSAVTGSLESGMTQAAVAALLGVKKQAVNAEVMRYLRLALEAAEAAEVDAAKDPQSAPAAWLTRIWRRLTLV